MRGLHRGCPLGQLLFYVCFYVIPERWQHENVLKTGDIEQRRQRPYGLLPSLNIGIEY
ncbi:MAG: hypothetical protein LUF92_02605 [Clostridiales bacterium]|nr:hypothetical protein [Clostridiales bacterium]